jgi:hypothetical protein
MSRRVVDERWQTAQNDEHCRIFKAGWFIEVVLLYANANGTLKNKLLITNN